MTWHDETVAKTRLFLENMVAEGELARRLGMDATPSQVVNTTIGKILEISEADFPLARLMDASDVLFHAEGPGAAHGMPWMRSLTWLLEAVDSNVRRLCAAALDLWGADGRALSRHLDLRVPGVVPGSIWVGIKLEAPVADLLPADIELMSRLGGQLSRLPELTKFIGDEGMRPGIEEAAPDPAMRDAQLGALYKLSPTGKRGIHTLEVSSRGSTAASLGQRERVVLREVIEKPKPYRARHGSFVGEVREADLDKRRIHLRNVPDVGTLRCIMPDLPAEQAAKILGQLARVTGQVESDPAGRPRLMFVESIEPTHQQQALRLSRPRPGARKK